MREEAGEEAIERERGGSPDEMGSKKYGFLEGFELVF